MYIFLLLPPFLILAAIFFGIKLSAPGYKGPKSDHFNGSKFQNYDGISAKGFGSVLKWMVSRDPGKWKFKSEQPHGTPNAKEDKLTLFFVNHSTFLIQWNNINILTDPVWSERTSPFSFAGPRRMRQPGIAFSDLPQIDIVLLSHNHYDHLDLPTAQKLWERDKPKFIVPLGVDHFLKKSGLNSITTLDWWQQTEEKNFSIEMVPSQHFSGRGLTDRDKTLWGGYMLEKEGFKLYFVGDTGYNEHMFDDIHKKHPNIDLALVPVGAYKPKWFMSPIHVSPEDAVKLHQKLNIKKSIGMHYGTFPLADDGQYDPPRDLLKAKEEAGLTNQEFLLIDEGERFNF